MVSSAAPQTAEPEEEETESVEEPVVSNTVMVSASDDQTEYVASLYDNIIMELSSGNYTHVSMIDILYDDEAMYEIANVMSSQVIITSTQFYDELPGVCESG